MDEPGNAAAPPLEPLMRAYWDDQRSFPCLTLMTQANRPSPPGPQDQSSIWSALRVGVRHSPTTSAAVLRRATLDAIALANNAADKLSADNPDPETTRLFRAFFGHDPSRPIPWADNQPSRLSVASRFRSCARELNGGRRTQYSCVCAANAPAGRRGETHSPLDVRLCPAFWRPAGLRVSDRFFRAGVVLHEMVHQLFGFVGDISDVSRRVNAHCYEAFAMRLASPAGVAASLATPTPSSYRTCTDYSLPVSRRTAKDSDTT